MTLVLPVVALAAAAAAGLVLGAAFEPAVRRDVPFGLAGLLLALVAAAAPNLLILALIALVAVLLQARLRPGGLPAPAPALGAGLLAAGGYAAAGGGVDAGRLAALACALAIAALAGVLPFLVPIEADGNRPGASALAWTAFAAPALAIAVFARTEAVLPVPDQRLFGGLLLALGSLNLVWGVATTLTREGAAAWRATLLSDWGFALIGLGLLSHAGAAAAYLVLAALLLLRLPELLWGGRRPALLMRLALGGSPPFAGFPARLLLLRAATATAWPLALALAAAMVVALPASLRLGGGEPGGRRVLAGQALALAVSAIFGLYPEALLRPVGLG